MQKVANPVPIFVDARGSLIDSGKIYIGQADADPETNPIVVFWDAALTIPAQQPLRTLGGLIVNGTNPAPVFVGEDNYSMRLKDAFDNLVFYSPSLFISGVQYQPLDSDLTAIAALATSAFGRGLLTLANQTALRSATGIPDPLPLTGGTVTGDVKKQGAGTFFYGAAGLTGCRVFNPLPIGTTNPASEPGDIVGFY